MDLTRDLPNRIGTCRQQRLLILSFAFGKMVPFLSPVGMGLFTISNGHALLDFAKDMHFLRAKFFILNSRVIHDFLV